MKMKHSFLFGLMISLCVTSFAQEAGTLMELSVDDAVRIALDSNLSLRRSTISLGTAKRAADLSWNSLLPTLSASATLSHPTSIIEPTGPDVWALGFSLSAGFTFSASVFENIKRARADYESGLLTYEAMQQDLEFQVRKLFYQILLLDANRELAAKNFESAHNRYEQTAALTRIGQAPMLDELSARVDMENQRPAMINSDIIYENALDSFKQILGIPAETVIRLDGDLGEWGVGSEWGIEGVQGVSLEVLRLLQSIRSMEAQRNMVRNGVNIPSIRLSWTTSPFYNFQNKTWNDNGSFSISLGMSLDNFLPWSSAKAQIDALSDSIRAAEIELTETLRKRENRVSQNMRTIVGILQSLEAIKLNVELAQSTYAQYEDAYRRGAADYQRLRGAGDSLDQANHRLLQEQYNLVSALLELEKELNIPFGSLNK